MSEKPLFKYDYIHTLGRFWRNEKEKLAEAKEVLEKRIIPYLKKKKYVYTDFDKVNTYGNEKMLDCKNWYAFIYKRGIATCVVTYSTTEIILIILLPVKNKMHSYSKINFNQKTTMCFLEASIKYSDDPCLDALHETINTALDHIIENFDTDGGYLTEMVWNDHAVKRTTAKLDDEEVTPEISVAYNEVNDQKNVHPTYLKTMFDIGVMLQYMK